MIKGYKGKIIVYENQRVYLYDPTDITKKDIKQSEKRKGIITRVYFFECTYNPLRMLKVKCNKKKIETGEQNLNINIKDSVERESLTFTGLDKIVSFLIDSNMLERGLKSLKGKKVTQYYDGFHLLGISL